MIEAGSPEVWTKSAMILLRAIALLDRRRPAHTRVKLHDIVVFDTHAGVDLAAVIPNPVPGAAGCVGQLPQGTGAEAAVDRDHLYQQLSRCLIESIAHQLSLPIVWVHLPCPALNRLGPKPFEFPVKILEHWAVLPGLEAVPDERLSQLDKRPHVTEVD